MSLEKQSGLDYDEAMTNSKRHDGPHCSVHPDTALVCMRCIGAKGGRSRSKAKLAAVRENAKLGGRPPKKLARRKLAAEQSKLAI